MTPAPNPHHPTFENMDFSKGGVEKSVFCAVCKSFCPCWIEDIESRLEGHSGHWADCENCDQVTEVLPPNQAIKTPEGFTCERIGGGFKAFIYRVQIEQHTHFETLEFWLCHQGTASAPTTFERTVQPCFVEVSVDDLSSDEPEVAVQIMEAFGLTGGSNGCSGALTWHFDNMAQAVDFVLIHSSKGDN
jgi:hypothetical protein